MVSRCVVESGTNEDKPRRYLSKIGLFLSGGAELNEYNCIEVVYGSGEVQNLFLNYISIPVYCIW